MLFFFFFCLALVLLLICYLELPFRFVCFFSLTRVFKHNWYRKSRGRWCDRSQAPCGTRLRRTAGDHWRTKSSCSSTTEGLIPGYRQVEQWQYSDYKQQMIFLICFRVRLLICRCEIFRRPCSPSQASCVFVCFCQTVPIRCCEIFSPL